MKKYFIALSLTAFVLSPMLALASSLTYTATFPNYYGASTIPAGAYTFTCTNDLTGNSVNNLATTAPYSETLVNLGGNTWKAIFDTDATLQGSGFVFSGNVQCGDTITFTPYVPGGGGSGSVTSFSVPTSTAPTLMAYASGLLANPGFLAIIALIIGVPFAFWAIDKLIALVPGNDKKRRHK